MILFSRLLKVLPILIVLFSVCGDGLALDIPIKTLRTLKKLHSLVQKGFSFSETGKAIYSLFQDESDAIFEQLQDISKQIKNVESSISEVKHAVNNLKGFIKRYTKIEQLDDLTHKIDSRYKTYEYYAKMQSRLEPSTLEAFAQNVIEDSSTSIKGNLLQLHNIAYERGLINMLIDEINQRKPHHKCSLLNFRSKQQDLYQIYIVFILTEIKGCVLMEFSYQILRALGKGNFTTESEIFQAEFQERTDNGFAILKDAMKNLDRSIWRCEPNNEEEGKTYIELVRLFRGVLEHENNLIMHDTCSNDCDYFNNKVTIHERHVGNPFKCEGKYHKCEYFARDFAWKICPAPSYSSRRYNHIESWGTYYGLGEKQKFDDKPRCQNEYYKIFGWLRGFYFCDLCYCICDDEGRDSDRYFNLRDAVSDIANNMVVTGVRFVKKNQFIHLQVQEGKFLSSGFIDKDTVRWVPVSDYSINDLDVHGGRDYHMLSWDDSYIDLDTLQTANQPDYVVTGVRFRLIGSHLNLQIRTSKVDFDTGIVTGPSKWKGNNNSVRYRRGYLMPYSDIPTRSSKQAEILASSNAYTSFVPSDRTKDMGQTVLPLIDAQDVIHDPPVPLEGIGLFLKGIDGYGGYIAPKIITYDYSA